MAINKFRPVLITDLHGTLSTLKIGRHPEIMYVSEFPGGRHVIKNVKLPNGEKRPIHYTEYDKKKESN